MWVSPGTSPCLTSTVRALTMTSSPAPSRAKRDSSPIHSGQRSAMDPGPWILRASEPLKMPNRTSQIPYTAKTKVRG